MPREDNVSFTSDCEIVPLLLWSRTENASRIEWRSWGGNLERLSDAEVAGLLKGRGFRAEAVDIENVSPVVIGPEIPRLMGEGGGSVCALVACWDGSSSSSVAVKDCFSLEGDVMGDSPFLPGDECGDVDGLPTTVVGEDGDEGRRKGDARGELKDNGDGLYAEAYVVDQPQRSIGSRRILPCSTIAIVSLMKYQQT
jgi:hypothetical protein